MYICGMNIEEKYQKDFQKFLAQFPDERAYWQYLIDIRCPEGYICPHCKSEKY